MKSRLWLSLFSFVLVVLIAAGCATIIKGTSQDISINSNPPKASVVVKTMGGAEVFTGSTPASVKLPKKKEYIVVLKMEGYKDATVQITQSFENWFLGNLLCGGVIGMVVDAIDGAMWNLEPDHIVVSLVTASVDQTETRMYALLRAVDSQGQLRSLLVPLIRENIAYAK